jgi:hypothetical protein
VKEPAADEFSDGDEVIEEQEAHTLTHTHIYIILTNTSSRTHTLSHTHSHTHTTHTFTHSHSHTHTTHPLTHSQDDEDDERSKGSKESKKRTTLEGGKSKEGGTKGAKSVRGGGYDDQSTPIKGKGGVRDLDNVAGNEVLSVTRKKSANSVKKT